MTSWMLTAAALLATADAWRRLARMRELVAHAAHELRGPLTAAGLALDTLGRGGGPAPPAGPPGASASAAMGTAAAPVDAQAGAAAAPVDAQAGAAAAPDLLVALDAQLRRARLALDDLTAAPSGRRAADRLEPVGAAAFVSQLALAWEPVARSAGVRLVCDGPPLHGTLLADRTRLAQAAGNLLANAVEHGAGPIELRPRAADGRLRLEVRDAGPGLPAPVARLARRPRGPRGRGLAIARGIAERHGGRVLAAPSPGGATVVLELPLLPEGETEAPAGAAHKVPADAGGPA